MEKQPHKEYRDELANKLKEIRNSGSENPEIDKAKAQGYLDAKKDTQEYKKARKEFKESDIEAGLNEETTRNENFNKGVEYGRCKERLIWSHDATKTIRSIISREKEYCSDFFENNRKIINLLNEFKQKFPESEGVVAEILKLNNNIYTPKFDTYLASDFANEELDIMTTGAWIPQPQALVNIISEGKLRDIYEIVRVLAWDPISLREQDKRYSDYKKDSVEADSGESKINLKLYKLFTYSTDANPDTIDFFSRVDKKIISLLEDKTFNNYNERFKIPQINNKSDYNSEESILWNIDEEGKIQNISAGRLLPILVYSLRFAFDSAWVKTLLECEKHESPLSVDIDSQKLEDGDNYKITISFPLPIIDKIDRNSQIPYYNDWEHKMDLYMKQRRNFLSPWIYPEFVIDGNTAKIIVTSNRR